MTTPPTIRQLQSARPLKRKRTAVHYQPRNSTEHEPSEVGAARTVVVVVAVIGCLAAFLWSESATELCRMAVLLARLH